MALDPEYLVVHTAAYSGPNCDKEMIDRWHRQKGWNGIGYHFVIINDKHDDLPDGTLQEGRPVDRMGAHVKGINSRSLGICCVGHGDKEPFTDAQRKTLFALLSELMDRFAVPIEKVIGHREVNRLVDAGVVGPAYRTTKTCPGRLVDMDDLRTDLKEWRMDATEPPGEDEPVGGGEEAAEVDPEEVKRALAILALVPFGYFPNASQELRELLFHPEVIEMLQGDEDG